MDMFLLICFVVLVVGGVMAALTIFSPPRRNQ